MLESVQAIVYVKWCSNFWNEVQTLKLKLRHLKYLKIGKDNEFCLKKRVIVCFVKSLNVDCGLIRQYPWIGNSKGGVVLEIYSFIVMGYWWATSLFVKLISHILFCMYMCSKIPVPLGSCWLCVNPSFHSNVYVVWDVGTKCFRVFYVGFREDVYVEGSPLVSHIENNLKWPEVFMKMRSKWSNLERLVVLD